MFIRSTRYDDGYFYAYGTAEDDLLKGRKVADTIYDLDGGNDTMYGYGGDDYLVSYSGFDYAYGGIGNDNVAIMHGGAYGQRGDDNVASRDYAAGGFGNDFVSDNVSMPAEFGFWSRLHGDAETIRKGGDDFLYTNQYYQQHTMMTGGPGADVFAMHGVGDGVQATAEVIDFQPGVDKIRAEFDGYTSSAVFAGLDLSNNGVLDAADMALGAAVWTDGYNFAFANGDDLEIVHGVDHLNASDWIFQ